MKTQQKFIKFSKGEINQELNERTDIDILDNSASYIKNYIPTLFGGIKTRFGTEKILKFNFATEGFLDLKGNYTNQDFYIETPQETRKIKFKINSDFVDDTINLKYIFEDVEDPENAEHIIKKLISIEVEGAPNDCYNYNLNYATDKENISNAVFNCDVVNNILNISFEGDLYYDEYITWDLTKDKKNSYNFQIKNIDTQEIETMEILFNEDFEFTKENNNKYALISQNRLINYEINFFKDVVDIKEIKIIPFIFSKENFKLIVITKGNIFIIDNDIITQTIELTQELSFNNIKNIKYSQNENIIILTDGDKRPRILTKKNDDTWNIDFFNIVNVPYHCFNEEKEEIKTNTISPSATSGSISISGSGFNESYVGQIIDGNGGRVKITEYINSNKLYGFCIIPFYTSDSISKWKFISGFEPSYSEERGWPNTCLFYQNRLFFAGSRSRPLNIIGSRVGVFNDFLNSSNNSNDALDFDLFSNDNSEIINLLGVRNFEVFTGGAEFVAGENNITPTSFSISQISNIGSKKETSAVQVGSQIVYIEKQGRNIYNLLYDYEENGYKSTPLSLLNNNIIKNPISISCCYNSNYTDGNFIIIVNNDGTITIDNILNEQNFNSFSRIENKDVYFYDCVTIQESTYFLTKINSNIILLKSNRNLLTDNTIIINNFNSDTIEDLEDINNLNVKLYYFDNNNNVVNLGDYKVENNKIVLDQIYNIDKLYIGLVFECELISNNIMINNKSYNNKKRIASAVVVCDKKTTRLNFNNKEPAPIIKENDKIYKILNCSNFDIKTNFKIKSQFDYLEIKSITLNINSQDFFN